MLQYFLFLDMFLHGGAALKRMPFPGSSMAEQVAVNDKVLGSSPSRGAKFYTLLCLGV